MVQIAPKAGLKKGDYEEIRMNTNDMVAAMVAKTIDAMVTVEPYNAIAEADGIANSLQGGDSTSARPARGRALARARSSSWSRTARGRTAPRRTRRQTGRRA